MKTRLLLLFALLSSALSFSQISFSSLSSSLITNTSATVSVTLANVCAGATYHLQYSTSAAFGVGTVDELYSTSGTNGLKNLPINGLTANTAYYFRFYATVNQACNAVQIVSTTASFTTTSSIIAFSNLTSSAITNTTANVAVTVANACAGSTYQLEYSTSSSFNVGTVTTSNSTSGIDGVKNHSLSGLTPNTTYYYRFYSPTNQACNAVFIQSSTASFTTTNAAASITFSSLTSSLITNTSATVSVTLANVCAGATYQLQYSTSAAFGAGTVDTSNSTGGTNGVKNHNLTGLTPNTTYYFRFYATANQACNAAQIVSTTVSFTTTNAVASITFSNLTSSLITNTSATVSVTLANVCAGANYQLQYSTSAAFGAGTVDTSNSTGGTNGVKNHNLTGLTQNTTYYFRFYATANQACNAAQIVSTTVSFTTTNAVASITFSNLTSSLITNTSATVSVTLANVCAGANYQLQYSTSAAFGAGTVDTNYSTSGTNGVKNHNLTGLTPNATYYFRFYAADNQACNATQVVSLSSNFTTINTSTPTFTQVAAQCSGATFTLPTTSTNGISGTWSPVINNTATTTYTFTPTAGQGASTTTMSVTIITNPNVTPNFPGFQPICSGGSFTLPTTSPNGVTGTWSPAFNNMVTTTYTFVANPGQCSINATRIVTVNSTATPTGSSTQTFVTGQTIANIVVNPTNVVWYASTTDAASNSNPLPIGTTLVSNTTYYAVSISGNCSSTPFPVNVTVTLGLNKNAIRVMNIYPNPVIDIMNVESANEIKSVVIFNLQGQKVKNSTQKQLNVSDLSSGVYMVKIQDKNNAVSTQKIVKQ